MHDATLLPWLEAQALIPSKRRSTGTPCAELPQHNFFRRAEAASRRKKHERQRTDFGARNGSIVDTTSSSCSTVRTSS